jgi:DinB superfamily
MKDTINNFRATVEDAYAKLSAMTDDAAAAKPAADKWSAKQIIGHLIDSASNNHQRFVRAQFKEDLVFDGYEQEKWVDFHDYQNTPWKDLLELWRAYNLHLARVRENTPDVVLTTPRAKHNLYQTALNGPPADQPATLEYFMLDYIKHLKQHLGQIDEIVNGKTAVAV